MPAARSERRNTYQIVIKAMFLNGERSSLPGSWSGPGASGGLCSAWAFPARAFGEQSAHDGLQQPTSIAPEIRGRRLPALSMICSAVLPQAGREKSQGTKSPGRRAGFSDLISWLRERPRRPAGAADISGPCRWRSRGTAPPCGYSAAPCARRCAPGSNRARPRAEFPRLRGG